MCTYITTQIRFHIRILQLIYVWGQIADVSAHAAAHYDHFGAALAISGDELFVGAPNSGDLDQVPNLSDTMYLSISFRKPISPQDRQLTISIGDSGQ